jgi:PST family polysaccharide transporter
VAVRKIALIEIGIGVLLNASETKLEIETEPTDFKRRSVHGGMVSFIGQAARFVLQIGSQLYIAHLVSPSAFGLVAMAAPILRFVQLFNAMGLLEAVIQRPSISHRELSALFWINLLASSLFAVAFAAAAPVAAWFYGEPRLREVMFCLCLILLLGGLSAQPMALLNRRMRFVPLTLIDVLSTAAAAVVGIGMATLHFSYWSLVGMQATNSLVLCALAWLFSGWRPSRPRWEPEVVPLLGFGGHISASNVLGFFAESSDRVLLGAATGGRALGLYDRSSTLVMTTLTLVMTTFTRIAVPLLSRLVDTGERYRRTYLWILQTVLTLTMPGLLVVILVPGSVIQVCLGSAWLDAIPIIRLLALGAMVHPIIGSTAWLFVSQGRAEQQLAWGVWGYAAIAASFVAGLPWGAVGVAGSWATCSWLVWAPMMVWAATRHGPVHTRDLVKACVPMAAGTCTALLALWVVSSSIDIDSLEELVLALVLSYGSHGLMLALLPGGKHFLRDTWRLLCGLRETPP